MTGQPDSAEGGVPLAVTPPGCPSAPVPPLLRLPLELHQLIAVHLSLPGYLALRLTHPYLYNALAAPVPTPSLKTLDSCARLAVRTYLAPYFAGCNGISNRASAKSERKNTTGDKSTGATRRNARLQKDISRHCLLCAAPYGPRLFKSTSSPAVDAADHGIPITTYPSLSSYSDGASSPRPYLPISRSSALPAVEQGIQIIPRSNPAWDVLPLPDGVCAWHVSRFARVVHEWPITLPYPAGALDCWNSVQQESTGKNQSEPLQQWCWYAFTSTLCPHCGTVGAFNACTCTRASISTPLASIGSAASPRAASNGRTHAVDHDAAAPQQRQRGGVVKSALTAATGATGMPNDAIDDNTSARCQTCALRPVTVYLRYLPYGRDDKKNTRQKSWDISSFRFWRDSDDRLWVREEGFTSSPARDGGSASSWHWGWSRLMDAWSWGWPIGWSGGREAGGSGRKMESKKQRRLGSGRDGGMRVLDVPVKWIDM